MFSISDFLKPQRNDSKHKITSSVAVKTLETWLQHSGFKWKWSDVLIPYIHIKITDLSIYFKISRSNVYSVFKHFNNEPVDSNTYFLWLIYSQVSASWPLLCWQWSFSLVTLNTWILLMSTSMCAWTFSTLSHRQVNKQAWQQMHDIIFYFNQWDFTFTVHFFTTIIH